MDAEGSFVLRKHALKLGCSCYMDDCAAPGLAWTCQLFGFPVSCRLVCCAGCLEMWAVLLQGIGRMTPTAIPHGSRDGWEQTVLLRSVLCQISRTSRVCFMIRIFQKCSRRSVEACDVLSEDFQLKGRGKGRREKGFCCMLGGFQGALIELLASQPNG